MTANVDPDELLDTACAVVRAAAELAGTQREEGITDVGTKSSATDLVTAADRAVERLILAMLADRRPADAVLGEETGARSGLPAGPRAPGPGVRWVVDPIDGTVNYVYGLAPYAVSVAAEVAGVTVVGVVRNVVSGEEWAAVRGQGAWRAERRLSGSSVVRLDQALVATGFAYDPARRAHQAGVLAHVLPKIRDIRRFGAASVDLCLAAEGRVDAYYEKGLRAWDHAAGGLIAAEAGLVVSGLRGAPAGPDMVLAAPPALHAQLYDLLATLSADAGP